jgi:hypothetical protein
MNYTNFISATFKNNGVPNLDNNSFALLMNIVHLEGKIKVLQELNKREKYKYDINIIKFQEQIKKLTNNLAPQQLMIKLTSNY